MTEEIKNEMTACTDLPTLQSVYDKYIELWEDSEFNKCYYEKRKELAFPKR